MKSYRNGSLRAYSSYRTYVCGLRLTAIGFLTVVVFTALLAIHLPFAILIGPEILGFCLASIGVIVGGFGYLRLVREASTWLAVDQVDFIRMVFRDVVRGAEPTHR